VYSPKAPNELNLALPQLIIDKIGSFLFKQEGIAQAKNPSHAAVPLKTVLQNVFSDSEPLFLSKADLYSSFLLSKLKQKFTFSEKE
jgi:hypothetical protein